MASTSVAELHREVTAGVAGQARLATQAHAPARKPLIFISHKHDDAPIAKALASWLQMATRNAVEVFQSSDGFREGAALGRSLTEEIRNKANEAAAMLVLYTDPEQDWEWVMFEVGIGLDPSTPEAQVILFQCGPEAPQVLRERLNVDVRDANSCIRFARQLLTTEFFEGCPPLADFDSSFIERLATQLRKDIEPTLPRDVANDTWSPHPRIRVRVDHVDGDVPNAALVRCRARITADADNKVAREVFDVHEVVNMTLGELADRNPAVSNFVELIVGAMTHQVSASARVVPIPGTRETYFAVLTEVRKRPFQRATLFDLHLVAHPFAPASGNPTEMDVETVAPNSAGEPTAICTD
jgi:hypothetical protein